MTSRVVLVAGASGLVGRAAVERFAAQPDTATLALSRRDPQVAGVAHVPLDLRDPRACLAAAPKFAAVTHLVYAASYETPGVVRGWRDRDQMQVNLAMLRALIDALDAAKAPLRHVSLLQGTKAYGAHLHPIPVPARESAPRDDHENFYWLQEDELRARRAGASWRFAIFRPQVVIGHADGSALNALAALGAWAAIRADQSLPFGYAGGAPYVCEATDARLLARAIDWAGTAPAAADETFNVTNGDVFSWRELWPALARAFGAGLGPPEPVRLAVELPKRAGAWAEIARKHRLRTPDLATLVGESAHYVDFLLAPHLKEAPPPVLVSTIKLRQAGFADCIDTEAMFAEWIARLQVERVLPPPLRVR